MSLIKKLDFKNLLILILLLILAFYVYQERNIYYRDGLLFFKTNRFNGKVYIWSRTYPGQWEIYKRGEIYK